MKLRIGNDVTTGELFIGTDEQKVRYGIKYTKGAYYETFVGDKDGYISDRIYGHVDPFRHFIVKSSTIEMPAHETWESDKEYTAIDKADVTIIPDYEPELIAKLNELRKNNAPITEAFSLLNLTTAEEQEMFSVQWYSKNENIQIDENDDPDLTQVSITTETTYTLAFNHKLSPEQIDAVKKNLVKHDGDFQLYAEKDNSLIPNDLKATYPEITKTVKKGSFSSMTTNVKNLI